MLAIVPSSPDPIGLVTKTSPMGFSNLYRCNMKKIDAKSERFAYEYLVDLDPVKAAIRCGHVPTEAKKVGPEYLEDPVVQEIIEKQRQKYLNKLDITKEKVLREYSRLAFSDITKYYIELSDGSIRWKTASELNVDGLNLTDASAAITEVIFERDKEKNKTYIKKVKVNAKNQALDSLAKYFGLFEKDNSQKRSSGVTMDSLIKALPPELQSVVKLELIKQFKNTESDGQTIQ